MQHLIILPDLGQTTSEAKVLKWLRQPGAHVWRGEPILEVETGKVNMEVESFESGYLRELLVEEGAIATALTPIAIGGGCPGRFTSPRARIAAGVKSLF